MGKLCWINFYYSTRETLEVNGRPKSLSNDEVKGKVCDIFGKLEMLKTT